MYHTAKSNHDNTKWFRWRCGDAQATRAGQSWTADADYGGDGETGVDCADGAYGNAGNQGRHDNNGHGNADNGEDGTVYGDQNEVCSAEDAIGDEYNDNNYKNHSQQVFMMLLLIFKHYE